MKSATVNPPPTKAARLGITLRGDRNQCAGCGLLFNSTHAFDKHRTGSFSALRRRCLSAQAMTSAGMVQGTDGFWRGSAMPQELVSKVSQ